VGNGSHPLDRVLVPVKGFVFRRVFRSDEARYLAFRRSVVRAAARAGLYEGQTLKAIRPFLREGDVALDVGASFGVYTAELARRVGPSGHVHAFEPQRTVYEMLVQRFRGAPSVHVVNAALADEPGSAQFVVPTIASDIPETALGTLSRGSDGHTVAGNTEVTTLDDYCAEFDRLAFIKIDAEGWDVDVLRGGRKTLERLRPVVQVEVNDEAHLADLTSFADEVAYRVEDRVLSGVNRLLQPH
jgi:FkbM family methyltransferase